MEQNIKYKADTICTLHAVVRTCLSKLGWKLIRKNCIHEQKKVVFEDYVERCTLYWCEECRSDIYNGWD